MLGMLWGAPNLDDRTKARRKNRIANLLHDQLRILPDAAIEDSSGDLNRKAVGYVYSRSLRRRCRAAEHGSGVDHQAARFRSAERSASRAARRASLRFYSNQPH